MHEWQYEMTDKRLTCLPARLPGSPRLSALPPCTLVSRPTASTSTATCAPRVGAPASGLHAAARPSPTGPASWITLWQEGRWARAGPRAGQGERSNGRGGGGDKVKQLTAHSRREVLAVVLHDGRQCKAMITKPCLLALGTPLIVLP